MRSILAFLGAAGCMLVAGWPAAAQSIHIQVGDLSTPEAVRAFDDRLETAARRFCSARYASADLDGAAACQNAIREEALAQLAPGERQAYAEARRPRIKWTAR